MDIHELKNIAESVENALLEQIANKQIIDYDATIATDGSEINIWYKLPAPIKKITLNLRVASKF